MLFFKWKKKAEELEVENVALKMRLAMLTNKPQTITKSQAEVIPINAHTVICPGDPEDAVKRNLARIIGESIEPAIDYKFTPRPCSNLIEATARIEILVRRRNDVKHDL